MRQPGAEKDTDNQHDRRRNQHRRRRCGTGRARRAVEGLVEETGQLEKGAQGRENPSADRTGQRRHPPRDHEGYRLVGHSVRGFLSTAAKKHGLKIGSTKTEGGDRVYSIKR